MSDIERRAYETQKYLQESETKDIQDYKNGDDETKQNLWNIYISRLLQGHRWDSQTHEPELINFSDFRKNNKYSKVEDNLDRFLPGIIEFLQDYYGDEGNPLEIIFILDEQAKKYLEVHGNLANNSQAVGNVIDGNNVKKNKTSKIEGVDLSSEELAEKIGDLFYDSLASFLSSLGEELSKGNNGLKQVGEYLKTASNHIMNAWRICLPYVGEGFPNLKHSTEIKGLNISREELIKNLGKLTNEALIEFLLNLSKKIHIDGIADEGRGRKKLSNELFETAKNLELAGNTLKKNV
ncbi:MAG: hypothetical protein AB7E37_05965 [Candidatus Altimarinota bacterium]